MEEYLDRHHCPEAAVCDLDKLVNLQFPLIHPSFMIAFLLAPFTEEHAAFTNGDPGCFLPVLSLR